MKILPNNFYIYPEIAKTTMSKKDLKELLLATEGWVMINGYVWDIKNKLLGAGIYQVYLEKNK